MCLSLLSCLCYGYRLSRTLTPLHNFYKLFLSPSHVQWDVLSPFQNTIRGTIGICSKYLVHTPPLGATARGGAEGEGGKEEQRYLRHIILHYVPKRHTNAVLIYASPRGDKKKKRRGPRGGGEGGRLEIRGLFRNGGRREEFRAGNHQDNAVGGTRMITRCIYFAPS